MDFFISTALAQSGDGSGGGLISLIPLVLIFVLFYFLLIRPQQKKTKQHKQMVESLEKGEWVATNGGMIGEITAVDDYTVKLQVAPGVVIENQKVMVAQVLPDFKPLDESAGRKKKKKKKPKAVAETPSDSDSDADFESDDTGNKE